MNLKNISTVHARSEEYTKCHIEEYDVVVSRAVAHLKILSEITFQSIKIGGFLIAMKGNIKEELEESRDIINKLNGQIEDIIDFTLPVEKSTRTLIKIKKIGKTNPKYPRRYSEIKKKIKD